MAVHILVDTDSVQTVANKTLTTVTITSPVLGGTTTGTYTLGGSPTISAPTISGPSITGILTVSGHIKFPATQNASSDVNTLDDYEEGIWTPVIGGTASYTTQLGIYTKIGNRVFISGQLVINTIGTGSTSTISGLPFTANNNALDNPVSIAAFGSIGTSVVALYGRVLPNTSTITFHGATAAATNNTGTSTIFGNGANVTFSAHYII
jgi:hypothetical protein